MKDFWTVIRVALSVIALPLLATAAVSALNNSDGSSIVTENVLALRATNANVPDSSFRHHTVSIDADGVVRGRVASMYETGDIVGLRHTRVSFMQDGLTVSEVYTKEDGTFEAVGLAPGGYSFVAAGGDGFAAFGVRVVADPNTATNNVMEIGVVNPKLGSMTKTLGSQLSTELAVDPLADFSPPPGGNHIRIVDGRIRGSLSSLQGPVENVEVFLIRNQEVVASGMSGADGVFFVEGVEAGVYDFVAKSQSGFAAFGFVAGVSTEALSQSDSAIGNGDEFQFVSTNSDAKVPVAESTSVAPFVYQESMDVALVAPQDAPVALDTIQTEESVMVGEPVETVAGEDIGYGIAEGGCCGQTGDWGSYSSGGCCGGGGGGGGGLGGMGGLASVARAAILGWVLVELFDQIDFEDDDTPPPATPSS